ncbi:hypothetical protein B7C62_21975 [Kitasatospora albolonga]|uniref:Translation initiation factor IF-2 n=1 Tax=Kitasatospora albolonga TaxID=68173 RepID=A0ABC8BXN3_9ACTN|nr:hypothetical protein B7C62_21975 [Kitasatospora albolonga]
MVEGEERARSARGSPGERGGGTVCGAPPERDEEKVPPAREAPTGHGGAGPGPASGPPDGFSDLLATLGAYLEHHPPADVAVLLRAELERREFLAYANGWRDAADQYEPALEQARRIARTRRLRLVGRTPGQAAVIPFPQDAPTATEGAPNAAEAGEPAPGPEPGPDGVPEHSPDTPAPPRSAPPGPGLVAKNRNSRAPTIPRLAVHRPGRPDLLR